MVLIQLDQTLDLTHHFQTKMTRDPSLLERGLPGNSEIRLTLKRKQGFFVTQVSGKIMSQKVSIKKSAPTLRQAYLETQRCLFQCVEEIQERLRIKPARTRATA